MRPLAAHASLHPYAPRKAAYRTYKGRLCVKEECGPTWALVVNDVHDAVVLILIQGSGRSVDERVVLLSLYKTIVMIVNI